MNYRSHQTRFKSRLAFTLFEAVVTLVVIASVATITFAGVRAVTKEANLRALATQMSAVRAAGRTVAAANAGTFPSDTEARLPLNGLTATTNAGPSTSTTTVSVWVISPTRVGYAIVDGTGGCLGLWDDLTRPEETAVVWLHDEETEDGNCAGQIIFAEDPRIETLDNHDYRNPAPIDFDAGYPDIVTGLLVEHEYPGEVKLFWDMPGGPTTDRFVIYRAAEPIDGLPVDPSELDYEEVATVDAAGENALPVTEWIDTEYPPGTNIYYRISARGRVLQTMAPPSVPAGVLTIPSPATSITATPFTDHNEVEWAGVDGDQIIDSYQITVNDFAGPAFAPGDPFFWSHTSSFTPYPWKPSDMVTYTVAACNASGCSASIGAEAEGAPKTPVVTAAGALGHVRLSWPEQKSNGQLVPQYTIERSLGITGTAGWVGLLGDTTSTTNAGALEGSRSLEMVLRVADHGETGKGGVSYGTGANGVPVPSGSGTYTVSATAAVDGVADRVYTGIRWYDGTGQFISESIPVPGSQTVVNGAAQSLSYTTSTIPPAAQFASPVIWLTGAEHGATTMLVDSITFTHNGGTNLLAAAASTFESAAADFEPLATITTMTAPGWVAGAGTTVTRGMDGETSRFGLIGSPSGGPVEAWSSELIAPVPVPSSSAQVNLTMQVRHTTGSGDITASLVYYNAGFGALEPVQSATVNAAGTWSQLTIDPHTPPLEARFVRLRITGNLSAGSAFAIDNVNLVVGSTGNESLAPIAANFNQVGYIDTTVPPGVTALYRVRAVNSSDVPSTPAEVQAKPISVPNATILRDMTPGMLSATAHWFPLSEAGVTTGWQVWYTIDGGTTWQIGCSTSSSSAASCTISPLPGEATVAAFAVPVVNGNYGAASNTDSTFVYGKPSTPATPVARARHQALFIDWTAPTCTALPNPPCSQDFPIESWSIYRNGATSPTLTINHPRPTAWHANSSAHTIAQTNSNARTGSGALMVQRTGEDATVYFQLGSSAAARRFNPVYDNAALNFSACLKLQTPRTVTYSVYPVKADGTLMSATTQNFTNYVANSYVCNTFSTTVAHGAATVVLRITVAGMAPGEIVYADDIQYQQASTNRLSGYVSTFEGFSWYNSGLTNGTSYTYQVAAHNGTLLSDKSAASTGVAPAHWMSVPGAPPAPTVSTSTVNSVTGTINKLATGGATGYPYYKVYRSSTVVMQPGTASSFSHTGLSSATNYCYQVAAVNGMGEGPKSAQACRYTLPAAPATPTNTTRGWGSVGISWTKPSGTITGYQWRYNSTTGGTTTGTTATKTGLTNCTNYTFSVRAQNASGYGAWSANRTAKPWCGYGFTPVNPRRASTFSLTHNTWKAVNTTSWSGNSSGARALFVALSTNATAVGHVAAGPANSSNACSNSVSGNGTALLNYVRHADHGGSSSSGVLILNASQRACFRSSGTNISLNVDVYGYFKQNTGSRFVEKTTPQRVGPYNASAGQVVGRDHAGEPTSTNGIAVNTTVNNASDHGWALTYSYNTSMASPQASTVAYPPSVARATFSNGPSDSMGRTNTYTLKASSLIHDSWGFYRGGGVAADAGAFFPLAKPVRVLTHTISGASYVTADARSASSGVPSTGVRAVTGTIAGNTGGVNTAGHLNIYKPNTSCSVSPGTSILNWVNANVSSNGFTTGTNSAGQFCIRSSMTVTVYVDIHGYFANP